MAERICKYCGEPIRLKNSRSQFCSKTCQEMHNRKLKQIVNKDRTETVKEDCKHPDCAYRSKIGNGKVIYCSYMEKRDRRRPCKISECQGYLKQLKQIENGETIRTFLSVGEASETLGMDESNIKTDLKSRSHSASGYSWEWEIVKKCE